MNNQKTGELILNARKNKGYTQKELADKLNVSDRAVSKWERGLNYPDITLLSPLADVLDITVAELLSGEKLDDIDTNSELVVRSTVAALNVRLRDRLKSFKVKVLIGAIALIIAIAATFMLLNPNVVYDVNDREIPISVAVSKLPGIIITGDEFLLAQDIMSTDEVSKLLLDPEAITTLPTDFSQQFLNRISVDNQQPESLLIEVIYGTVYVDYTIGDCRYILSFFDPSAITKAVALYDAKADDVTAVYENSNNASFKEFYQTRKWFS